MSPVCTHTQRCPVSCGLSTHLQSTARGGATRAQRKNASESGRPKVVVRKNASSGLAADETRVSSRYSTDATHLGFAFLILSLLSVSSCLAVSLGCVSSYSSSSVYALCCLRVSLLCCFLAGTTSGGRRETPSYRSSTTPPPVSRRGTGGGRLARSWKRRGWPHRRYKRASGYVFINHAPFLARRFVQQRFLRLRVHSGRVDLDATFERPAA